MKEIRDAEHKEFLKSTSHKWKDKIFNKVLLQHTAAGRKRKWYTLYLVPGERSDGLVWRDTGWWSDEWFWKMCIYKIPEWIGILLFIYVIYWLGNLTYVHYGAPKLALFIALLFLVRLNRLISLQVKTNRLLGEKEGEL